MRTSKIVLLILLSINRLQGQHFPDPMVPLRLVNDYTGLLTEQQQIELNNKLLKFNNETSTQIYVVTYDDLQGYDVDDYGVRLASEWGIGQEGKDNGILILVSPANRVLTIQTGYGLEGAVPDVIAKRLIEHVITPGFREENYYEGLDSAANVLMSLTRGEFTADDYLTGDADELNPLLILILIIIVFMIVSKIFRTSRQYYSPTHSIPWWIMGTGSSSGRNWSDFNSGSGGFGGFSGGGSGGFGGFSGGGGGSFGGGGASGRW
ncbi:MAG: TPM domain-containing protein [Bacteroidales bacterium]|nr:TPM domain-containing protein [Bacteroidales bacterium]